MSEYAVLQKMYEAYSHCSFLCSSFQVLEHWEFSEIKDYTFSGYSFTLVRRGNFFFFNFSASIS